MLVQEFHVHTCNQCFGVKDGPEVKPNTYMDVHRGGSITANVFEKGFWFGKVKALHIDEFRIQNLLPLSHFEEVIDNEEELCETAGKW